MPEAKRITDAPPKWRVRHTWLRTAVRASIVLLAVILWINFTKLFQNFIDPAYQQIFAVLYEANSILIFALGAVMTVLVITQYVMRRRKTKLLNAALKDDGDRFLPESEVLILYLRSFTSLDQDLAASSRWKRVRESYTARHDRLTTDGALSRCLSDQCTFVAIGDRDGDTFKLVGNFEDRSLRIDISDQKWKELFAKLCGRSQIIICACGDTPSSRWELEQITGNAEWRARTIIFAPQSLVLATDVHAAVLLQLQKIGVQTSPAEKRSWCLWLGETRALEKYPTFGNMIQAFSGPGCIALERRPDLAERVWRTMLSISEPNAATDKSVAPVSRASA